MKAAIVNTLGQIPQLAVFAAPQLQDDEVAIAGKIGVDTQEHAFAEIASVWDINKKSDRRSVIRIRS